MSEQGIKWIILNALNFLRTKILLNKVIGKLANFIILVSVAKYLLHTSQFLHTVAYNLATEDLWPRKRVSSNFYLHKRTVCYLCYYKLGEQISVCSG